MKSVLFLCLFVFIGPLFYGQSSFSSGILPKVRVSYKLTDQIKWINGIESRQLLIDDTNDDSFNYDYVLTDISSLLSFRIGAHGVLNGGYLLRIKDEKLFHRTIQQYNLVFNYDTFRIGHRFATDQTFNSQESVELRGRYRITLEKPLSGNNIDQGEFYLKLGNEYIFKFQDDKSDLEMRVLPFLGYEINTKNKIEIGLDYRLDKLLNSGAENDLWLSINWFYTIKRGE
ncbi:DUF2490 domain-containing protein [Aquimarina gracilis]|uniref:DUF2490 domain-containing protein n=1 Tax=Aquimarina gracilis TaxID=874422 RepID=A0ABU5ZWF9_9FLAO|nr:DUF2490 domain-containing protein [Aquimarina gracilis]MEB3346197.1 DUF2490 domain-containing protein [Aquimarina gracilis]